MKFKKATTSFFVNKTTEHTSMSYSRLIWTIKPQKIVFNLDISLKRPSCIVVQFIVQ